MTLAGLGWAGWAGWLSQDAGGAPGSPGPGAAGWAGLELAHGNCNAFCAAFRLHTPASPAQPSQNTRKKGSSLSGVAGPRSGPRLGGSPLIGLVSPLRVWCLVAGGHFTFCAEAGKCQELGIRMRRGWRKVARCWVVKCAAAPGHGAALFISPLHRNQQLLRLSSGDGPCHHNPELKVFSLFR